jgi:DnaJ family protein C protein 7
MESYGDLDTCRQPLNVHLLFRYAESQEVSNDLLRMDHMKADAIYVRGLCLYYEDNVDKAFTHFQQVLRLAPGATFTN